MTSDPNRLPRLVEGLELRALPISPAEAFVLSRVDGASSESEIAAATGLEVRQVTTTLSRLVELGAVRFEAVTERPRPIRSSTPAGRVTLRPIVETKVQISEHPSSPVFDQKELEEPADLEPEHKRRVLEIYYRLERMTHYELLELEPSADRRAIKSRYYEVVNLFHPDRYFGRQLGNFKPKLERIFQRVTEAYDVLSRSEARAEYDAYLTRHVGAETLHKLLNDEQARARQLREIEDKILAEARLGDKNESLRPPSGSMPAPEAFKSSDPASPSPRSPSSPSSPSASDSARANDAGRASDPGRISTADLNETRRRVLARKLGATMPPPASRAQPTPVASSPESRERAVQDLKRRYEERLLEARRRKATEYVAQADQDLGRNDLANAVNALRIAASLLPSDDALAKRARELEARAVKDLADRYVEQAEYEEREGRFSDAVRSYTRALAGKPSAHLHDRTAHCLLSSNGDMKKAVEHARFAVAEVPNNAAYRVTLARAFIAANMNESALGELERAKTLAPTDDTIKGLIRRLQRGA